MPLMPAAINTPIAGPYCLPLVACMAYSVTPDGKLSEGVDVLGNVVWDATRRKAQRKAEEIRQQGFVGAAMLPMQELDCLGHFVLVRPGATSRGSENSAQYSVISHQ